MRNRTAVSSIGPLPAVSSTRLTASLLESAMLHFEIRAEMPSPGAPVFFVGFHAAVLPGGNSPVSSCSVSSAAIFVLQGHIAPRKCGYSTSRRPENSGGTSDKLLILTGTISVVPSDRMVKSSK